MFRSIEHVLMRCLHGLRCADATLWIITEGNPKRKESGSHLTSLRRSFLLEWLNIFSERTSLECFRTEWCFVWTGKLEEMREWRILQKNEEFLKDFTKGKWRTFCKYYGIVITSQIKALLSNMKTKKDTILEIPHN